MVEFLKGLGFSGLHPRNFALQALRSVVGTGSKVVMRHSQEVLAVIAAAERVCLNYRSYSLLISYYARG